MSDRAPERTLAILEDRLAADLADMERLHEAATRLLRETDVDSLLHEILVAAIAITRADMGNMQTVDEGTGHLRIRTQIGFAQPFIDFFDSVPPGEFTCGAAWTATTRVVVADVGASPLFADGKSLDVLLEAGVRAVQSTPLISRSGRRLGIISTHFRRPHEPAERELRMLDLLARQAADLVERTRTEEALRRSQRDLRRLAADLEREVARRTAQLERQAHRLRRLAAELTRAEQRERKRLAGRVHDHLQQLLVAARMRVGRVQRILAAEGPAEHEEVRRDLEAVQELTGQALRTAGSITAELRPPISYDDDMIPAFRWLCSDVREKFGLDVRVEADEPVELPESTGTLMFECVREAVFNIVKHAGVGSAVLRVRRAEDRVEVAVEDRGRGFDPARLEEAESGEGSARFGLFSIAERLAAVGGELRIESAPGEGTRVGMRVPLGSPPGASAPGRDGRGWRIGGSGAEGT